MPSSPLFRAVLLVVAIAPLTGCLFRSRKVEQPLVAATLKSATQQDLVDYVNTQAAKIQTMQATVDIDTSVGGAKKGKVTDYQEIRGYVLARKPAMLRMIGLMPIVRNRAFDMVSDGKTFKLWIPSKNRFVVGQNDVQITNAARPLDNLRPQHIYDALLVHDIDPQDEIAVLESTSKTVTDNKGHKIEQYEYVIDVIHHGEHGWFLSRKLIFSRVDLLIHRQLLYDDKGNVATDASYENYKDQEGMSFPWQIEIVRPQEEYDITLNIVKLELNQPLPDDKFVLEQPPGVEVVHLDKSQPTASSLGPGGSR
jgi:outer membrane lipoprotein-sorting protein